MHSSHGVENPLLSIIGGGDRNVSGELYSFFMSLCYASNAHQIMLLETNHLKWIC